MCFSSPKISTSVPAAPSDSRATSLASDARLAAQRAKGVDATIATSALGDAGFGSSLKRATVLGQTSSAAASTGA